MKTEPLKLGIKAYNDHFWVSGFGESGKTVFVKNALIPIFLQSKLLVAIYDYNHNYDDVGIQVTGDIKLFAQRLIQRQSTVYQAPINNEDSFSLFCKVCLKTKPIMVIMEELQEFCKKNYMPDHLSAIIRTGRNAHLSYVAITQRPQEVPTSVLNNAKHRFYFKQDYDSPRDKAWLYNAIGDMGTELMNAKDYSYVYKLRMQKAVLRPPIKLPKAQ